MRDVPPAPRADTQVRPYVLERFQRDAARHAAGLPPETAERWILRHGLLSLSRRPELPDDLRRRLEPSLRRNLARNLLHVARFRDAVDVLDDLPVCPVKGIHLLATVYADDPQHRAMSDLDLLVRAEDAPQATRRLEAGLSGLEETDLSKALRKTDPARDLVGSDARVDLHVRLADSGGAWADLEPAPGRIHDRDVFLLDPETVLAHLTIHFVRHGPFVRLGWVEDLLRWAEAHEPWDGVRMLDRARRLGGRRAVLAGLRLLRRSFGRDLLPTLPRPSAPERLLLTVHEALAWTGLRRRPWTAGELTSPLRRAVSGVLLADGPRQVLAFLRTRIAERRTLARTSPPLS